MPSHSQAAVVQERRFTDEKKNSRHILQALPRHEANLVDIPEKKTTQCILMLLTSRVQIWTMTEKLQKRKTAISDS